MLRIYAIISITIFRDDPDLEIESADYLMMWLISYDIAQVSR